MTMAARAAGLPAVTVSGFGAVACGLALVLLALPALAQRLPPSAEPGRIEQRFQAPAVPESKPEMEFPAPEKAPPPEQAGSVRLMLHEIVLDGNTVYPESELRPLYQDLLDHEVSLLDLYRVRDAITARYRNDGYILSQALVPAQKINQKSGSVHLRIVEGYINEISFEGKKTEDLGVLQDYADAIKNCRPLRAEVLERYVLLADDLPGINVRTVIKPAAGEAVGSDMVFVIETKQIDASLTLDNRGTPAVGPYQITSAFGLSDLMGIYDRTTLRVITTPQTRELLYFDLNHTEQLDSEGTTMTVGARNSWSTPGSNVSQFDVKTLNTSFTLDLSHPLIRTRAQTLRLFTDFTYRDSLTDSFGSTLSDDRVRYFSLGASYDVADGLQGSNLFKAAVHKGFDILDASDDTPSEQSRPGARSDFIKYTFSAQRLQPLPWDFGVLVALDGQASPDRLLSGDQYGVGGSEYGRAFDPSEITGDQGGAAKAELQYNLDAGLTWVPYLQLYLFYDYGRVFNYAAGPGQGWSALASVGSGLRYGITDTVGGSLEIARPMIRVPAATGNDSPRAFFSLTAKY